jgi:hypothetical protein
LVTFKKLKIMQTSNQMGDTHVALRFELREYAPGGGADDYRVLHTAQSVPFMVMSHSSQLKKPKELAPVVQETVPPEGLTCCCCRCCFVLLKQEQKQGSHLGGTRVVVLGANFMDTPALRVRFGRVDVQPVYHGPRTLSCLAPPARAAGPVAVAVCNDAARFGAPLERAFVYVTTPDPGTGAQGAAAGAAGRIFYDLGSENLAGRAWTTGSDGSEMFFGLVNEPMDELSGSYDFNDPKDGMNIHDSN